MLSGLLLSASFLSLVSVALLPSNQIGMKFLSLRSGRLIAFTVMGVIVVTMGWIASRGSAVAGILGMMVIFVLTPKRDRSRKAQVLMVFGLALGVAVVHTIQRKDSREFYAAVLKEPVAVESILDAAPGATGSTRKAESILGDAACKTIVDSVSDRWVHYEQAVALFLARPLWGAGANHYGFYACTGPGSFPHSTLLQVFSELGIIVGVVYCTLLMMTLQALLQAYRRSAKPTEEAVWTWLVAFAVVQVLIAQLNGNYFVSAALYYMMGVAASAMDEAPSRLGTI
jgi:O-antigen ligase